MKTKLFISAIALAIASFLFTYSNSYSKEANCCASSECCSQSDGSCCEGNNCGENNVSLNTAGGIKTDSVLASIDSAVCVVTGEKIAEGKGINFNYLGKDYKLCCENCLETFQNEPIKYVKDDMTCMVMGEPVKKNISASYKGTKYYFCCKMCISQFNDEPEKYLKQFESKK